MAQLDQRSLDSLLASFGYNAAAPDAPGGGGGGASLTSLLSAATGGMRQSTVPRSAQDIEEALNKYDANSMIPQSFNQVLSVFLDDLQKVTKDTDVETTIIGASAALDVLRMSAPVEPMRRWMLGIREHRAAIVGGRTPDNERYLIANAPSIEYLCELQLPVFWHTLCDEEKDQIWDYFQQLDSVSEALFGIRPQVANPLNRIIAAVSQRALASGTLSPQLTMEQLRAVGGSVMSDVLNDPELNAALDGGLMVGDDPASATPADLERRQRDAHDFAMRLMERQLGGALASPPPD